jgi:hypothetical protein
MQSLGVLLSTIALLIVGFKLAQDFGHWRMYLPRVVALIGELTYFTTSDNFIGAIIFLAGAAWTIATWFQKNSPQQKTNGLVEMVELFAWLWIALTLR